VIGVKQRWLPVGLLTLAIFVVNVAARFISWKAHIEDASAQTRLGVIGVSVVGVVIIAAGAWWAIRYPFPRVFGDVSLAVLVGALLSVIVGPWAGGSKPFEEGLAFFVSQLLLFLAIGVVAMLLGFIGVVALGKDWKSRGLLRYERAYERRTGRATRG
jgi:hypothetical protein